MSEHTWVLESIAAYSAGGLQSAERERVERHAAGCDECGRSLAEHRGMEETMETLFADVRPAPGLESRVIEKLRTAAPPSRIRWRTVGRIAAGFAAVLFLGVVGAGAHSLMTEGKLPFLQESTASRSARAAGEDSSPALVDNSNSITHGLNYRTPDHHAGSAVQNIRIRDLEDTARAIEDTKKSREKGDGQVAPAKEDAKEGLDVGIADGSVRALGGKGESGAKRHAVTVTEGDRERRAEVMLDSYVKDLAGKLFDSRQGQASNEQLAKRLEELNTALELSGKKGEVSALMARQAEAAEAARIYAEKMLEVAQSPDGRRLATGSSNGTVTTWGTLPPSPNMVGGYLGGSGGTGLGGSPDKGRFGGYGPGFGGGGFAGGGFQAQPGLPGPMAKPGDAKPDDAEKRTAGVYYIRPEAVIVNAEVGDKARLAKASEYFTLTEQALARAEGKAAQGEQAGDARKEPGRPGEGKPDEGRGRDQHQGKPHEDGPQGDKSKVPPAEATPPQADPQAAARKIIRTGDMEFEIDSFDSSVAAVTRLILGIRGAFVATINSEKLPNGKVRGSVVVRMPPETLDKFVLDLRGELGKVGELKSQRIGSSDVTKQYYDLESRLKAARTMEERLIKIIQSGKGEIKDLLAAERELGVWRTKIEEMEGEIRYYNNQVSLSTLTITLYEKEIRSPSALVISEHVNMEIEVDDVEKSQQAALAAVAKAKGRVLKADLQQHPAGQLKSDLQFEVAPAEADKMRETLRQLGIVSKQDAKRLQQAEGGSGRLQDGKTRQNDTLFHVVLYNFANIQPRQSFNLQIDSIDVPGGYRKLQDLVAQVKGQVRAGQLNEQDKLNISANIDFDVPTTARDLVEKTLAEVGDAFSRTSSQVPVNETATERKIGFRIIFRNAAAIQPRQTYTMQIDAADVPAAFRKLQELVLKLKGRVLNGQLSEKDRIHDSAQLDFDIATMQRDALEKALADAGEISTRTTAQAGPAETATDRKLGYRVSLRNIAAIPPRETFNLQFATRDVPGAYQKLQEAVEKAKGRVYKGELDERDKFRIMAELVFELPKTERESIEKLLASLGAQLSRATAQIPRGENASDRKLGYRLWLRDMAGIEPREKVTLHLEVNDVDATAAAMIDAVMAVKGIVPPVKTQLNPDGRLTADLLLTVPYTSKNELLRKFREGTRRELFRQSAPDPQVPDQPLAIAYIDVKLYNVAPIVASDEGFWPQIRAGLSSSVKLLSYSLMFIIVGMAVVLPWALLIYAGYKLWRRLQKKPQPTTAAG